MQHDPLNLAFYAIAVGLVAYFFVRLHLAWKDNQRQHVRRMLADDAERKFAEATSWALKPSVRGRMCRRKTGPGLFKVETLAMDHEGGAVVLGRRPGSNVTRAIPVAVFKKLYEPVR